MTTIDFAGPATSKRENTVRIVTRSPRLSPRDAYAAEHIIVDRRTIFHRRIQKRIPPVITVNGFRR